VITGAETLKDVIDSRKHHKDDKYLLQERVVPAELAGRRAWFRVFFVCGVIFPCWWTILRTSIPSSHRKRSGVIPSPLLLRSRGISVPSAGWIFSLRRSP